MGSTENNGDGKEYTGRSEGFVQYRSPEDGVCFVCKGKGHIWKEKKEYHERMTRKRREATRSISLDGSGTEKKLENDEPLAPTAKVSRTGSLFR